MGKFDANRDAVIKPGKTVGYRIEGLPGQPVAHVAFLDDDDGWRSDQAAKSGGPILPPSATREQFLAEKRRQLRFAVKRLEARYVSRDADGRIVLGAEATDADIPEWVESLPLNDIVEEMYLICRTAERFREKFVLAPDKLAEK